MSNALSEEKKQQVIALGKLGWSLRKIERETGVRRETAGAYLKAVGIAVRIPRAWGRRAPPKPANEVTPDFVGPFSQIPSSPAGRVSACEPYRDLIEEKLSRGRNAKAPARRRYSSGRLRRAVCSLRLEILPRTCR